MVIAGAAAGIAALPRSIGPSKNCVAGDSQPAYSKNLSDGDWKPEASKLSATALSARPAELRRIDAAGSIGIALSGMARESSGICSSLEIPSMLISLMSTNLQRKIESKRYEQA